MQRYPLHHDRFAFILVKRLGMMMLTRMNARGTVLQGNVVKCKPTTDVVIHLAEKEGTEEKPVQISAAGQSLN